MLPYNIEETNAEGTLEFLEGANTNIPRRIPKGISPTAYNMRSKWKLDRIFHTGKFDLTDPTQEANYCSIMTAVVSGWFKLVWVQRTVNETQNTTKVIVDIEYYEQEYIYNK